MSFWASEFVRLHVVTNFGHMRESGFGFSLFQQLTDVLEGYVTEGVGYTQ